MNQLILLHDTEGNEIAINISIISSCARMDGVTFVYRKDRQCTWKVKETPAEIVAMQWGGICNA